jgi:tRNA pseudouridine55 synthase
MKKEQFKFPRRVVDGLILLDKPKGLTSNSALQKVRNLYKAEKAGHTGALDPLATGVLPICIGEATKVAGHLLGNDKAYEVTARLGITTDTDDAEGQILQQRAIGVYSTEQIKILLEDFIGEIQQVPPIYSALKQGGEPMYVKARRGDVIDLPARSVNVHSITLNKLTADTIELSIVCGTGTYIRSIVRDLGERLGCGAHVTELRRTWVQPFQSEKLWTIEQLEALSELGMDALDAVLMPVEIALSTIPKLIVDDEQARKIGMGQKITVSNMNEAIDLIQLCSPEGRCLGLASVDATGMVKVQRLFCWASIS